MRPADGSHELKMLFLRQRNDAEHAELVRMVRSNHLVHSVSVEGGTFIKQAGDEMLAGACSLCKRTPQPGDGCWYKSVECISFNVCDICQRESSIPSEHLLAPCPMPPLLSDGSAVSPAAWTQLEDVQLLEAVWRSRLDPTKLSAASSKQRDEGRILQRLESIVSGVPSTSQV